MESGRAVGRVVGAVAGIALAAACTSSLPPQYSADEFRGLTMPQVYARLNPAQPTRLVPGFGYISYDITHSVLGRPSGQELMGAGPEWTVVASCCTDAGLPGDRAPAPRPDPRIALGLVPTASVTPEISRLARARAYDHYLVECPGTVVTFTLPPPED